MALDVKEEVVGFITTRWVEAESDEDAELKAVESNKKRCVSCGCVT